MKTRVVDPRRALLAAAAEEAARRGDRRLGTDHLLLALLRDPDAPAALALGVSLADARAACDALDLAALAAIGIEVRAFGEPPPAAPAGRFPPLTSGARAVIRRAIVAGRPARTGRVHTRDFLLAILSRDRPDPAAELLHALGVDPAAVRDRLGRIAPGGDL